MRILPKNKDNSVRPILLYFHITMLFLWRKAFVGQASCLVIIVLNSTRMNRTYGTYSTSPTVNGSFGGDEKVTKNFRDDQISPKTSEQINSFGQLQINQPGF